ncbi:cyclic-phosphate processing receiver domain-containing protein [Gottfriedia sp. NPDC056225]|uniref:cyclic-phosphate processing receiver domain-containing protein n=1 Tax=Gottfriedia sp. NPDC056225 TaxID=3345751 RepID=UPI0035D6946B
MKLFVDDTRPVPHSFILAKSVEEALKQCKYQHFEQISLDYNLGFRKETGLDFIKRFFEEGYYVQHINLHSDDVFGVHKMESAINAHIIEETKQKIKITKISYS